MVLQFDRTAGRQRFTGLPVVFEWHIVDDELIVEPHRHPVTDHPNEHRIPLAGRSIGLHERKTFVLFVVPQTARAFLARRVSTWPRSRIPNLHLRITTQINAAVGGRRDLLIDVQLKIAIVLRRAQAVSLAVELERAIRDPPVHRAFVRPPAPGPPRAHRPTSSRADCGSATSPFQPARSLPLKRRKESSRRIGGKRGDCRGGERRGNYQPATVSSKHRHLP